MPIMTPVQHARVAARLQKVRSSPATAQESISKGPTNAASQAVMDRLENSKAILNSDIEDAAPGVHNAAQKRIIFANVAVLFALGEGAEV